MDWTEQIPRHLKPVPHILWEDVKTYASEEDCQRLGEWIEGQTCPLDDEGKPGIYTWDFDRWVKQGKETKQRMGDWD